MKKAARTIELQKTEILDLWEEETKKEVLASNLPTKLALRDHLPHLLTDMNGIMERYAGSGDLHEKETYEEILENSQDHGRHRSTSSGYTIDQILREYIIFHRILISFLKAENAYTIEVGTIIKFSIENAMLFSASAFNQSLQEIRQKLIGVLAHDMRNPVSAALIAVDIMEYDIGKERFDKVRAMAHTSLKRIMDLIEELLDSVTYEAGKGITLHFAEENIMETVEAVHSQAAEVYAQKIELISNEEEVLGIFDATMIRRVLENFLSNAVKYGARDAPITIIVEDSKEDVSIRVHNHGNVIPENKQKEIFQFMNTAMENNPNESKSWGMGLTLVKSIAEAHGGSLGLKSNQREGTIFSINLKKFENNPGKNKSPLTCHN